MENSHLEHQVHSPSTFFCHLPTNTPTHNRPLHSTPTRHHITKHHTFGLFHHQKGQAGNGHKKYFPICCSTCLVQGHEWVSGQCASASACFSPLSRQGIGISRDILGPVAQQKNMLFPVLRAPGKEKVFATDPKTVSRGPDGKTYRARLA